MSIYKTGVWTSNEIQEYNLPLEYQEVEYIESTGTQYIDTGVVANTNTQINITFLLNDKNRFGLYGGQINSADTGLRFFADGSGLYIAHGGDRVQQGNNLVVNTKYDVVHKKSYCTINNISYNSSGSNNFATTNISLFKCNGFDTSYMLKGNIYSCQIYDGDILIRNFIPCIRKSDNEVGLYDLIEGVFYTNSGSGSFTAGVKNDKFNPIAKIYKDKIKANSFIEI